jgi:4-hydroxy-2-oxoheptanedioate aldolase
MFAAAKVSKPFLRKDLFMKYLRKRVLSGEILAGTWCNLGSSLTVEMAGVAGFDWLLLDVEHGFGDLEALVPQLQAARATPAAPIARVAWNETPLIKRVLDMGASGVMVPYVCTADEARRAVAAMRYPPAGMRGVAKMTPATAYGRDFERYFAEANENLLTVTQIETAAGVENAAEIAGVEGVDVLFVGPMDLSVNLGVREQFDHPLYRQAMDTVLAACRAKGKAAGILLMSAAQIEPALEQGFTFVALGSDGGMVASGMRETADLLRKHVEARGVAQPD